MFVALGTHQSPLKSSESPNTLMPSISLYGMFDDVVEQVDRDVGVVDETGLDVADRDV